MTEESLEAVGARVETQVLLEPFYLKEGGLRFKDAGAFRDAIDNHDCSLNDFIDFERIRIALGSGDLTVQKLEQFNGKIRQELLRVASQGLGHNHISSMDFLFPWSETYGKAGLYQIDNVHMRQVVLLGDQQ